MIIPTDSYVERMILANMLIPLDHSLIPNRKNIESVFLDAAGDLGIAVRPEKVRIDAEAAAEGRISLHGRVSQIAYYGDTSHVFVALDSGRTLSAIFQTEARSAESAVRIGQELWCSWDPRDTLILGN